MKSIDKSEGSRHNRDNKDSRASSDSGYRRDRRDSGDSRDSRTEETRCTITLSSFWEEKKGRRQYYESSKSGESETLVAVHHEMTGN